MDLQDQFQRDWANAQVEYETRVKNPRPFANDTPEQADKEILEPIRMKWQAIAAAPPEARSQVADDWNNQLSEFETRVKNPRPFGHDKPEELTKHLFTPLIAQAGGRMPEPAQPEWSGPIERPGGELIQVDKRTGNVRKIIPAGTANPLDPRGVVPKNATQTYNAYVHAPALQDEFNRVQQGLKRGENAADLLDNSALLKAPYWKGIVMPLYRRALLTAGKTTDPKVKRIQEELQFQRGLKDKFDTDTPVADRMAVEKRMTELESQLQDYIAGDKETPPPATDEATPDLPVLSESSPIIPAGSGGTFTGTTPTAPIAPVAPLTAPAPAASSGFEVVRRTRDGRNAIFDGRTKQFIRYADE